MCSLWWTPICSRDGAYYYGTYTLHIKYVIHIKYTIHTASYTYPTSILVFIYVYSYGLSLVKGYKAQIKARRFASGEDFWQAVQASARSMSASIDTAKVESILQVSDSNER